MTSWYWVRHGPTHAKAMIGWSDLPADLSDRDALKRLSDALPRDAKVISSDLIRAKDTATAIEGGRPRLAHRTGLREMHYGDWEGLGFQEINERAPALAREFWENPGKAAPPGGESWNTFSQRIAREIDAISAEHPDTSLVAVAHFGVILAALQHATRMPPRHVFSFKIDNLSVTKLEMLSGGKWRVLGVNHLP